MGHPLTKHTIMLLALCVLATGCADDHGTGKTTPVGAARHTPRATATRSYQARRDEDGDGDGSIHAPYDRDDAEVLSYGRAGSMTDQREASRLVKRYLGARANDDGAQGCSLMYSLFAEVIPEEYGQPPGSPALRGRTCAVVMTKMFRRDRRLATREPPGLRVLGVRFEGDRGLALLGVHGKVESYLLMHRESGAWKVAAIDVEGMS